MSRSLNIALLRPRCTCDCTDCRSMGNTQAQVQGRDSVDRRLAPEELHAADQCNCSCVQQVQLFVKCVCLSCQPMLVNHSEVHLLVLMPYGLDVCLLGLSQRRSFRVQTADQFPPCILNVHICLIDKTVF